jgi:hypothetical protein
MKKTRSLALVAALALAAAPLFSQTAEAVQAAPPTQAVSAAPPATPAPSAQAVTPAPPAKPAPLRTELIKLMYLDYNTANSLLRAYSTTGKVSPSGPNASLIVVSDTPEVVAKMLQVIKEYDVKPAEIQFTVQIVQGGEGETDEALRNEPMIKDLRSVLKYKGFTLLDGTILRVIEGERAMAKVGPEGMYEIRLGPKYVKEGGQELIQVATELYRPIWVAQTTASDKKEEVRSQQRYNSNLIQTTLLLKAGEKTVVGVSKSDGDRGLILILSAKVVK